MDASSEPTALRVELNPFARDTGIAIPADEELVFVCCYEVDIVLGEFDEDLYLRRTATHDELWRCDLDRPADLTWAVRAPRGGTRKAAAVRLFKRLVRARTGHCRPKGLREAGLVDEGAFQQAIDEVAAGLERNRAEAQRRGRYKKIVKTARRLGLGPQAGFRSPTTWDASCPGTKHSLWLDVESNTFGCGYCRRKGGPEELEAFVAEREAGRRP